MITLDEKAIEAAARALANRADGDDDDWQLWREDARAAIAAYRDAEIDRLTAEVTHWKANHDNRVQAARFLIERPDMPVERVAAHDAHIAALQEIADLRAKLEAAEKIASHPLRYRHYKGGTYEYITDGHLEWAPEWHVIVYRAEADGSVWVRPRVDFYGVTEDGQRRFVKIEPEEVARGGERG